MNINSNQNHSDIGEIGHASLYCPIVSSGTRFSWENTIIFSSYWNQIKGDTEDTAIKNFWEIKPGNSPLKWKEIKWRITIGYIKAGWRGKILLFILIPILILSSSIGHLRWENYISFSLCDKIIILCTAIDPNKYKMWHHPWKWPLIQKLSSLG